MKKKIKKGIQITKLDAAVRQLETAIVLWFNNGDSLSIHTLVAASYQILYDLNKYQHGPCMLPDSELIKPEKQKEWKRILKSAANFMKHADKDPTATIFFNSDCNEILLLESVMSYSIFTKEFRPILQCFRMWFAFTHPDFFPNEFIKLITKTLQINEVQEFQRMNRIEYFDKMLPIFTSGLVFNHTTSANKYEEF